MRRGFWPSGFKILYEFVKSPGDRAWVENVAFTAEIVSPIYMIIKGGNNSLSDPIGRLLAHKAGKEFYILAA